MRLKRAWGILRRLLRINRMVKRSKGGGKLMEFLKGKKTYLLAFTAAVIVGLQLAGYIDKELANELLKLIGAGSLVTLRLGVANGKEK